MAPSFQEQKLVVIGSKKMVCFDDISKKLTLTDLKVEWEEGQPVPVRAPESRVEFPRTSRCGRSVSISQSA